MLRRETAAQLAFMTTSRGYLMARGADFASLPTPYNLADEALALRAPIGTSALRLYEVYEWRQTTAQQIIIDGLKSSPREPEQRWEMRRLAALHEVTALTLPSVKSIGAYYEFFQGLQGHTEPSDLDMTDLPPTPLPVQRTSNRILSEVSGFGGEVDALDFLKRATTIIDSRRRDSPDNVGPKPYAVAIKNFADLYGRHTPNDGDIEEVTERFNHLVKGFFTAAKTTTPNFVELNHLMHAVRILPAGSLDPKFSVPMLQNILKTLPDFNADNLSLLIQSFSNFDFADVPGEFSAAVLDLALRKNKPLETTREMLDAARAVSNIPSVAKGTAAEHCFGTFLHLRNNLEEPMNIESINILVRSLATISRTVVRHPVMKRRAKDLATISVARTSDILAHYRKTGEISPQELKVKEAIVQKTIAILRTIYGWPARYATCRNAT